MAERFIRAHSYLSVPRATVTAVCVCVYMYVLKVIAVKIVIVDVRKEGGAGGTQP